MNWTAFSFTSHSSLSPFPLAHFLFLLSFFVTSRSFFSLFPHSVHEVIIVKKRQDMNISCRNNSKENEEKETERMNREGKKTKEREREKKDSSMWRHEQGKRTKLIRFWTTSNERAKKTQIDQKCLLFHHSLLSPFSSSLTRPSSQTHLKFQ